MKICYLGDAGSIHAQKWAKYFADNGHDVHFISPGPFGDNKVENVKLYVLGKVPRQLRIVCPPFSLASSVIQIRRLINRIKPDVVNAHYLGYYGFEGALSGFHPFVASVWGSDVLIGPNKSKITRYKVSYTLKKADLITCDAEHIKEPLTQLGANPQKIELIYFGIDTQKFRQRDRDEKLREKLGIGDSPLIVSLRILIKPFYDMESLVLAAAIVLKHIPTAKFVIVGKGPQQAKLSEAAKSLGISESIKFLDYIPNDELPQYLASADIYVSTSLSDAGLAASTAEAMACGLPVIITDFGDNRKWVQDGVNGYIIPLRSPEVLASRIVYLIRNKDIRERFGQINRQIIVDRNNWRKEMEKMEKLYEELIERCKK